MAYDEALARAMRADLGDLGGIVERKMFGGLCFLWQGNMLCGAFRGGGFYRVGKAAEAEALAIPGTRPMNVTGRPMGGMVEADAADLADPARRGALLALARGFVGALPPK